ncbi:MAG: Gfo/Idh/MocA family oxidoreductase [Kiritimatiellae bacterium]|nr:Gfo/Idh/MocA family oxidoreductase [Kiritimatiellia bacterium]
MNTSRREFLGLSLGAAALAGCTGPKAFWGSGCAAPMQGFACAPLKEIRVGVVGVGMRGWRAVRRLSMLPNVKVTAMCDLFADRLAKEQAWLKENNRPPAAEYVGPEAYKALCDSDGVDVVYNCTPWQVHVEIGLYALRAGKHSLIEVPAAMTVDDCWELVETAEKTKLHCMQLENCCYGEEELLAISLCRHNVLGTLTHAECAYIHDRRQGIFNDEYPDHWRMKWNIDHAGNQYPTHGLVPACQCLDVNRGDRMDYLVSMDSLGGAYEEYAKEVFAEATKDAWKRDVKFKMANMNNTLVRTAKGRTILIQHDVATARPYSRIDLVSGTKGIFYGFPMRIHAETEGMPKAQHHTQFDPEMTERLRKEYEHPLWKTANKIAAEVGGHGGMDYIMDLRWAYCMQQGMPLDMDVYDLATTCSICELSEKSVGRRSAPVDVPDFTRGGWEHATPLGLVDVDLEKMGFSRDRIVSGAAEMKI